MNHKRGKPKHLRGGCLLCKPHKGKGRNGGWAQPVANNPNRVDFKRQ